MNTNIKKMAQNRLNTTKLGRLLKRFMHEEAGIAMEYVVLITLIAAAVAVGVWLFGSQILGMFQTAGEATVGQHDQSAEHRENLGDNTKDVNKAGKDADNRYTDSTAKDKAANQF